MATTRWLSYEDRISAHINRLSTRDEAKELFDNDFIKRLITSCERQEALMIKLWLSQLGLVAFLLVSLVSNEASFSFFGISVKQAAGLKEALLAMAVTISAVSAIVSVSHKTAYSLLKSLIAKRTPSEFREVIETSFHAPFDLQLLILKVDRELRTAGFTKILTALLSIASIMAVTLGLLFHVSAYIYIFIDIFRNPTLGIWSNLVLVYMASCLIFVFLLPYRIGGKMPFKVVGGSA